MSSDRLKTILKRYLPCAHIGIILLLGIISYANSLDVPLQLDDKSTIRVSISLNSDLYSIKGLLHKARWFADLTFAMNRLLHGERVLGYHLVNLAIHLSSAVIIFLFVQRVIKALKQTFQLSADEKSYAFLASFIPFMVAALFVCHPVQTQAVTYISQRYTALATLFYICSLLAYLQARLSIADKPKLIRIWSWSFASLFLALLAMKSKEIAFTLPLMAVIFEMALFRGNLLKNSLFLVITTVLLLIIPCQLIFSHGLVNPENMLDQMQAASAETRNISRSSYLLTQFSVVATYLRLLILPINQNWDYDYPVYQSLFNPAVLTSLLLHIGLTGIAVVLFILSKKHLNASGSQPVGIVMRLAALGIVWFYLALIVESSIIPIRDVIFEHRIYLPSAGFFMTVAATAAGIATYRQRYQKTLWVAVVLLCIAFTASTIARNKIWLTEMALWQDVLKKSPNKARARLAVGVLYFRKFQTDAALPHFVRAVELEPGRDLHWMNINSAIRVIDRFEGRCTDGMEYQSTVENVNPLYRKQWLATSSNNLGLAYEYLGNLVAAKENYMKALTFSQSLDLAWYNLALAAAQLNDPSSVETALTKLRTLNPLLEQRASDVIHGK